MDRALFERFVSSSKMPDRILSLPDILALIEKANPKWEKIAGKTRRSEPAYASIIEIPGWGIKLEIAVARFEKTSINSEGCGPFEWRLIVAEGEELRGLFTGILDASEYIDRDSRTIPKLFCKVDSYDTESRLKDNVPSLKRTAAAISLFLAGNIS